MTDLRPGLELGGRFALLRQLGQGGLGEVWLAEDRAAGERVALKFIGSDQRALAVEFERAQAAAAPGASLVRGLFDFDGRSCIAMDYLPGGDFGQFRGRSYLAFLPALREVARQLAAAHARDVVHRDLKCGNVLLDATERPRLVDFGLAAPAGAAGGAGGSPYNQSPQQLRGAPAAPADDLYAFGALLYELLSGHPPFYPEVTRDKVLFEPPPALVPRQPAPERLRRLALRLLAKSPAERPESFATVVAELDAAGAEAPEEPTHVVLPAPADKPGAAVPRKPRVAPWALAVGAAVLAVAAFLAWLPRAGAPDEAAAERAASAASAALAARLAAEQGAQEALQQATQARAEFERRYAALDQRAAAAWATAAFAAAQAAGAAAARAFDLGQHQEAQRHWQAAVSGLVALEAEAPRAFAAAMRRGTEALGRYRLDEARAAFTLAAAIEPANATPRRELERVTRFDRALALADAAARDERAGRVQAAQTRYREALALDPQAPGAREGLARLGAAQAGDAYAAAMAAGLEAQAAGRIAAARAEFLKAQQLRPGAAEPAAALQQLDQGQRADAVNSLAARAAAAEDAEDWHEALRLFTELAALEPTLVAARDGRARAAPRADLDRRLAGMVEKPDSVLSDAGRGDARRALAEADAIAAPGPRLGAQRAALAELLAAAERPVTVALESDGVTEVVIYRVGHIGAFARREVELLPGRYTAVGTRAGFRDVRREFVVQPGRAGPAVEVRCEEPI